MSRTTSKDIRELSPNSTQTGNQAILTLDMLGFSYCHIESQNFIQIQLKIQTKLLIQMRLILVTENS